MEDGLCRREICSSPFGDHVLFGLIARVELKKPPISSTCHIGIFLRKVWWGLGDICIKSFSIDSLQISTHVLGFY
jgi:hypothetical protein